MTKDLIDTLDSVRDPGLDLSLPWTSLKTQCLALLEAKAGLVFNAESDSFSLNDNHVSALSVSFKLYVAIKMIPFLA